MFEGVITAVLNKFLGDYVANMQQKQLNLGIFSGNIVLTDLRLKKEALDKLDLPIEVFYGHLGRLELHIPWRNLKSQPVTVVVEDLLLLAGPRVETVYDAELEEEREQKTKQEVLETSELFTASVENQLADDIQHESFTTQLVTKIVDNLQVTIKNIHIRFEDATSNSERPFYVGVTLKGLRAVSCDEDWKETFIVNPQVAVNKLVSLDLLSVYWDTHNVQPMKRLSFEEFVSSCRASIDDIHHHAYIIEPVSGSGRATLNKRIREGIPKTLLNIIFDAFGININSYQYYDILCALAAISTAQRSLPYRKWRPRNGKLSNVEMWKFAIDCHLNAIREKNSRRTWSFLMKRRQLRIDYINLFSNKIILGELKHDDAQILSDLERQIDVDDLLQYRSVAKAFAKKSIANSPRGRISRFWGWLGFKSAATSDLVKDSDIQELYETIDYDSSLGDPSNNVPKETQMLKVEFELAKGSFSLSQDVKSKVPLVSLLFTRLVSTIIKRPDTLALDLALFDLRITESLLEDSKFHELVQVKPSLPTSPSSVKPLLSFTYDSLSTNPDASAQIFLGMRPLMLIVNLNVVDKLVELLLNRKTRPLLEAVKSEAQRAFEDIQNQTRASLQKALEEHKGTDLRVKISAPLILIPEDPSDLDKSLFIVDLGKLTAVSELVSAEEKSRIVSIKHELNEEESETLHDLLYDRIRLKLFQTGIYFLETAHDWAQVMCQDLTVQDRPREQKLINELDLELVLENSIIPAAANIARTKLSVNLPEIIVFLSDYKIKKILNLLKMFPKSPPPPTLGNVKDFNDNSASDEKVRRVSAVKTKLLKSRNDDEFFDAFEEMKIDDDGFKNEPDQLSLLINVILERIVVFISKRQEDEDHAEVLRVSLMVHKIAVIIQMYETLLQLEASLGGIGVREHFSTFEGSYLIDASAASTSSSLIQAKLNLVKSNNSEFFTTFNGIERQVLIDIAGINVNLSPTEILECAEFAIKDILPAIEAASQADTGVADDGSGAAVIDITNPLIETPQPKTKIKLGFAGLKISLVETRVLGWLDSGCLNLEVDLADKSLHIRGDIKEMQVVSAHESGNNVSLVYFEGETVASFEFETNCSALNEGIIEGSNLVKLSSGSLCISYDADSYAYLLGTAFRLLKITELFPKPVKEKEEEKEKKEESDDDDDNNNNKENSSKDKTFGNQKSLQPKKKGEPLPTPIATYLDIHLDAPKLNIPSEDKSILLSVSLGTLKITNQVILVDGYSGFDQLFDICLSKVHMGLVEEGQGGRLRMLMNDATFPLNLRLNHEARQRNFADVEIEGDIPSIGFDLGETDFGQLMRIIKHVATSSSKIQSSLSSTSLPTTSAPPPPPPLESKGEKPFDPSQNHFPLDSQVLLRAICLTLKNDNDEEQVKMAIEGIHISAVNHLQHGFSTEVCIESVQVSDVAHPSLKFNNLLAIGLAAQEFNKPLIDSRKQLLFRMEQGIGKPMKLKTYLESPRIFVLFDTIFYLQKFFLSNLPQTATTTATATVAATATEATKLPPPMTICVDIVDAALIIPEDRTVEATDALSLRIGKASLKQDKNFEFALEDFSCSVYNMASPDKTRIAVIDTFASKLKIDTDPTTKTSKLDVDIPPLTITFSFQDLQLLLSFLNTMNESKLKHAFDNNFQDVSAPLSNQAEAPFASPLTGPTVSPTLLDSSASSALSSKMKPSQEEIGECNLDFIRVIIIDDSASANVPLLQFNIEAIKIQIKNWSSQLEINGSSTLALNCFNPVVSFWEPIIEKWAFEIKLGKLECEPNSTSTFLISSEEGIEVAVVHNSLERILSMINKLGREKRPPLAEREVSAPFAFLNLLDISVLVEGEASFTDKKAKLTLEPNQYGKFAIVDIRHQRSDFSSQTQYMSLNLGQDYERLDGIVLNRDGVFPMRAGSSQGSAREFYIHSYLESSVRTACIRERLLIKNQTTYSMVITFNGEETGTSKQLMPGTKICVPPEFELSKISISPLLDGVRILPIQEAIDLHDPYAVAGRVLVAPGALEGQYSFNILVTVEKTFLLNDLVDLSFQAPIHLENLLPFSIQLQMTQGDLKKVYDLEESEDTGIYQINPTSPFKIALSIPSIGMFSTNECLILGKRSDDDQLIVQNEKGLELIVELCQRVSIDGSLHLSVSPYYVLVNQTGGNLQVLSEANNKIKRDEQIFAHDGESSQSLRPIFIFSHPNAKSAKNRVRLRVGDSNWSEPVSFEAVGADFTVDTKSMLTSKWYNIGGNVSLGQGKFGMTKIVYIAYRFHVVNDTSHNIVIGDDTCESKVPSKSQVAVNFDPENMEAIRLKIEKPGFDDKGWSATFDIKNTGHVYVRNDELGILFRVGRTIQSPSFYISITETDSWPYVIENHTKLSVSYAQKNVGIKRECGPHQKEHFAWDRPSLPDKQLVFYVEDVEYSMAAFEIGRKARFKVRTKDQRIIVVLLEVKAKGPAVVVNIREKMRRNTVTESTDNESQSDQQNYVEVFNNVFLIKLPYLAISLIDGTFKEVALVYIRDVELRYAVTEQFVSYGLVIKWIQIDNQAFDWDHPMLLYPAILSKSKKELEEHPFLSFGAIQSRDRSYGVTYYKYLGLLIQEMSLEIGEELLRNLLAFGSLSVLVADTRRILTPDQCIVPTFTVERDSSEVLFFEFLQIHPMKISLTFSTTEDTQQKEKHSRLASLNPMSTILDVLIKTFGNISDAPLKFNALVLENILSRQATLLEIVLDHYKSETLSQVHLVLGSADFLGNPVGLVSTLGSGVTDLFYEPYQGLVSDHPQDIGIGLARGGISLVKKTVSGLSGTLSKFTGSLAKGLSAATLDKSWQQKRRVDRAKNKPRHALSGVSTGMRQLLMGFSSGLSGVVDKPWEGAKEGGVGGFFKGVGVGLVGAVTKPVIGLMDLTTSLTEGIKSSADDAQNTVTQIRFPRVIPFDYKVRPYDLRQAFGQSILIGVIGFDKVGEEFYIDHVAVPGEDSLLILTDKRLIKTSVNKLKLIWDIALMSIVQLKITDEVFEMHYASEAGLRAKYVPFLDRPSQEWFAKSIRKQLEQ